MDGNEWLDEAPCACVIATIDGKIKWTNRTFAEWVDDGSTDLVGRSIQELLTAPARIRLETVTASLALNGHLHDIALDVRRPNGTKLSLLCSASVAPEAGEIEAEVCWIGLDVSDRRAYERDVLVAQRRLRRLQDLSALLGGATTIQQVAEALLATFVDGMKADYGAVYLEDERAELSRVAVSATDSLEATDEVAPPVPEYVRSVMARAEPVFRSESEPVTHQSPKVAQTWHVAALPLEGERHVFGVVEFGMGRRNPHSENERQLLRSAVEMAAQAFKRVQLLDRLRRSVEENQAASNLLHRLEGVTSVAARAQLIVDFMVPTYADMASIEIQGDGNEPVAVRHVDPSMEPTLWWLRSNVEIGAENESSLAAGRELQRAQVLNNIDPSTYDSFDLDSEQRAALGRIKPTAYLGLPLIGRSGVTGSMMLANSNPDREFLEGDVDFLSRVTNTCALALENARLYEHERSIAQRLQTALLPERLPDDPRVRLAGFYQAGHEMSSVGGDWYDAFMVTEDRLGLVVGDVVGGGVGAATTMGALRVATQAFALDGRGVVDVIDRLNRFSKTVDGAMASSVVYVELDLKTNCLRFASAGHLPALVHRPGKATKVLRDGRRPLLGVNGTPAVEGHISLGPGWSVVLYTDGLVERRHRSLDEGIAELTAVLRKDPGVAEDPARLAELMKSDDHGDDTCILVATIAGLPKR
ncbi:MAG: SpoIIE family protein phosphatase [Acidimicrobiales bacterium]|nr:SpoIIE family protein phosphatase [Acidimicrobiales bacterium]